MIFSETIRLRRGPQRETEFLDMGAILRAHAYSHPHNLAFSFVRQETFEVESISYAGLDRRSRAIATSLQSRGVGRRPILLLYQSSLEYVCAIFGCLYAGAIAVPLYPPKQNSSISRVSHVSHDCQPALILTTTQEQRRFARHFIPTVNIPLPEIITTDALQNSLADRWNPTVNEPDDIAVLQYSSGSTGNPKGVVITHRNIIENEYAIQKAFRQTAASIHLTWLPFHHDMGLIGGVLQPVYVGAQAFIMSPASVVSKPSRWLQAISQFKATTSGGPNFAFELAAFRTEEQELNGLDLSSWTVAYNGSEMVRAETLERFSRKFQQCGFRCTALRPCYGLAEATLLVSTNRRKRSPRILNFDSEKLARGKAVRTAASKSHRTHRLVSCGKAVNQTVAIVHSKRLVKCKQGEIGEIWVCGRNLAREYWNHARETESTFQARLPDHDNLSFLRTGDLGFLHEGELYVTGRAKDVMNFAGQKFHPHDIEATVRSSCLPIGGVDCAVFSAEENNEEVLIIVQEFHNPLLTPSGEIFRMIRARISEEHGLSVYSIFLVRVGSIPKTSSGKIQHWKCRLNYLNSELRIIDSSTRRTDLAGTGGTAQRRSGRSEASITEFVSGWISRRFNVPRSAIAAEHSLVSLGVRTLLGRRS